MLACFYALFCPKHSTLYQMVSEGKKPSTAPGGFFSFNQSFSIDFSFSNHINQPERLKSDAKNYHLF